MKSYSGKIQSLSGAWKLIHDPENTGKQNNWPERFPLFDSRDIAVPGQAQAVYPGKSGVFWYYRTLTCAFGRNEGDRVFIRCQGVDYRCEAWLNGRFIGGHEGGETPFDLEVTGALKKDEINQLVMRVVVPHDSEAIDGLLLREIPSSNKREGDYSPGAPNNFGGIMRRLELIVRPAVMICDVRITACPHTGKVEAELTVESSLGGGTELAIYAVLSPRGQMIPVTETSLYAVCLPGGNTYLLSCEVENPNLWEPESPALYDVNIQTTASAGGENIKDSYAARVGFRELKVEQGYFMLNGRRIYLKSTHSGGDISLFNLYYLKTAGFNTIRIISNNMDPDLLDYCDDIGLMVFQEHRAAWLLGDSPHAEKYFDQSLLETVKRDKNHACLVIISLLNENFDNDAYRAAVNSLPKLREIDATRLVLLSSGRWDYNLRVGSVSNPFCGSFECVWGEEDPAHPLEKTRMHGPNEPLHPMAVGAGDIHVYPRMPMTWEVKEALLNVGRDSKPVFISEFGAGSQLHVLSDCRHAEQNGVCPNLPEVQTVKKALEALEAGWEKFGLGDIYPSIDDFLTDSFVKSVRQRVITFDLVRGNPKFCGYNLTGIMDHALAGEGLWTSFGEFKPGMMEAVRDGWNPLRFCLLVNPDHAYAGRPIRVVVRLADEDALAPGSYPVTLRIWDNGGTRWEHKTEVTVKEGKFAPFAYTVFDERVNADLKAGEYTLCADLENGGRPGNRRMKFKVTDKNAFPSVSGKIHVLGMDAPQTEILKSTGAEAVLFDYGACGQDEVIAVGNDGAGIKWDILYECIKRGAKALFLSPFVFGENENTTAKLPFEQKGRLRYMRDWLYHKEYIGKRHPALDGMQGPGILDWEYYGQLCNDYFFEGIQVPDDIAVACMATGYPGPGYDEGIAIGGYNYGEGYFMLNTMSLFENAGHPAADRLLINLLNYLLSPRAGGRKITQ